MSTLLATPPPPPDRCRSASEEKRLLAPAARGAAPALRPTAWAAAPCEASSRLCPFCAVGSDSLRTALSAGAEGHRGRRPGSGAQASAQEALC